MINLKQKTDSKILPVISFIYRTTGTYLICFCFRKLSELSPKSLEI